MNPDNSESGISRKLQEVQRTSMVLWATVEATAHTKSPITRMNFLMMVTLACLPAQEGNSGKLRALVKLLRPYLVPELTFW